MKILSLPLCVLISIGSLFIGFLTTEGLSSTRIGETGIWTRQCIAYADIKNEEMNLSCGSYKTKWDLSDKIALKLLSKTKITITCKAYQTRGPFGKVEVDC